MLASQATLETCLDKWKLQEACEGHVRVPRCEVAEADFDPTSIELPAFVKPRSGSGSRGIALITEISELERLPRDGTMLVQENLPGPEYSVDVLADRDGRVLAVVPRERMKVDSGIAVTARTVHDADLEEFGRAVAERIGLTGVANVQAKGAASGEAALLEVNARFPGTMPLTVASGVDMPGLCVKEALGEPMPEGTLDFEPTAMVRLMREHYMDFSEIEEMRELQAETAKAAAAARERLAEMDAPRPHPDAAPGHARPLDLLRRQEHDRGEHRGGRAARARASSPASTTSAPTPAYLPDYVAEIERLRPTTEIRLLCGIEAKLMDTAGTLDLPAEIPAGVDRIYAADHQVPFADGPHHPRDVKAGLESGELDRRRL